MQKTDRKSIEWQVLVVDENVEARKALARCLSRDYQVFSAGSVTDDLKILEPEQVDVLLSDLQMSERTGIDLLMRVRVTQPNDGMARMLQQSYEFDKLVFASDKMLEVCNLARRAATSNLPILIQGETGTGKELMARAVHFYSTRRNFPFLTQNCGALSDDLLHSELFGHKRGAFTGCCNAI